ncbi:MAG TPA: hypothetical protein VGM23_01795 [Armatimonadota bacterium]|jgi:hypothetical protein
MQASIVLTVAQGKRLIGKAVAQLPEVRRALQSGLLAIGRGTTNAYVAEEILGQTLPKGEYVAGRTMPAGIPGERLGRGTYPDIVLRDGTPVEGATVTGAVNEMKGGDVFIKGGNALNYGQGVVGVLMGHPQGGTIGSTYGAIVARKVQLIIPIGLEKMVIDDIYELSRLSLHTDNHPKAKVTSLFPMTGTIITEIEAFAILCGVQAYLLSAGGVAGAEGAIWLLLDGEQDQLDQALALAHEVQGEPNMGIQTGNA